MVRTSSNLLEPHHDRDRRARRDLSYEFRMVRLYGQGVQGARTLVRGGSSASNLLEPHHDRDNRACRVLSYKFGVV